MEWKVLQLNAKDRRKQELGLKCSPFSLNTSSVPLRKTKCHAPPVRSLLCRLGFFFSLHAGLGAIAFPLAFKLNASCCFLLCVRRGWAELRVCFFFVNGALGSRYAHYLTPAQPAPFIIFCPVDSPRRSCEEKKGSKQQSHLCCASPCWRVVDRL